MNIACLRWISYQIRDRFQKNPKIHLLIIGTHVPSTQATPPFGPLIQGQVFCLGDDISADDILAPEYLSFDLGDPEERRWLGAYALAHLADRYGPFVPVGQFLSPYRVLVAGRQFGRGSARIHSPIALAEAGVRCVVADSFGPGFMRAAVNDGLLHCMTFAIPGSGRAIETGADVIVDMDQSILRVGRLALALTPAGVTRQIVEAGGLAACLRVGGPR